MTASPRQTVLFVCTKNSARSQMAEGLMRQLYGDRYEIHSAGTRPSVIHPMTRRVLAQEGIDLSEARAKGVDEIRGLQPDFVITLCDRAREACPLIPARIRNIHAGFEDPAAFDGPSTEKLGRFLQTRDSLKEWIECFFGPESAMAKLDRAAGEIYCIADTPRMVFELLQAEAAIIQLRNKEASDDELLEMAREAAALVGEHPSALLIVNDSPEIAVEAGADGVHIGKDDMPVVDVREMVGERMIVGASARTPADAIRAQRQGASYIGTGSVFESPTRPDAPVIGIDGLRRVASAVSIPVVAIGGLGVSNIAMAAEAGSSMFAAISALKTGSDLKSRLSELREALRPRQ